MEVLSHPCEYFKVLFWCLSPPSDEVLLGTSKPPPMDNYEQRYRSRFKAITNDKNKHQYLKDLLEYRRENEEGRREYLDSKAQTMISQGGIAASLLAAAISILTISSSDWSAVTRIIICFFIAVPMIHLIAASLHARHVVVLKYGIVIHGLPDFEKDEWEVTNLIEELYIKDHNAYINDVKGTYLKIAHWLYKVTFITLALIVILIPLTTLFLPPHQCSN